MTFAVIDLETTGLDVATDRIIEIAVVHLDDNAHIVDTWSSLVNPGRPTGATSIHGITDADVADAPRFSDLLPALTSRLAGRVLVGHNVVFDLDFLHAEFDRAGYRHRIPRRAGVCTMDQSRIYLTEGRHNLQACLERANILPGHKHRALADATGSARLLATYLDLERSGRRATNVAQSRTGETILPAEWLRAIPVAARTEWPSFQV